MGWFEILVVLIVGLLVLGPNKVTEYARVYGRFTRQFRKMTSTITAEVDKAINLDSDGDGESLSLKEDLEAIKTSLKKDVSELKATLSNNAKATSDIMENSAKEVTTSLEKSAKEVSDTVNDLKLNAQNE